MSDFASEDVRRRKKSNSDIRFAYRRREVRAGVRMKIGFGRGREKKVFRGASNFPARVLKQKGFIKIQTRIFEEKNGEFFQKRVLSLA
jgi:hypothetical protein